jgi:hypothetical protein
MKEFKDDLTIIYLTANQQPEHWANYQLETLFKAIEDMPIIIVSRKPTNLPYENIVDDGPKSHLNMYKQMLKAAKLAKTPYIAAAEDDVLYSRDHFTYMRPPMDTVAYNGSRWSLYTWNPVFSVKQRISNCTLIAPRELWIKAWEERLAKFPNDSMPPHRVSEIGRNNQERWMGVSEVKMMWFYSGVPVIHLNHDAGTDSVGHNKKLGEHRALQIPYWGKATDILKEYQ